MKTGKLHAIETMGLVDGPGIRTVFFLKGCPLRCQYCHNPDTQDLNGAAQITASEVVATALRYKEYYDATGGGVTFSGGEPLMQSEFLLEATNALKAAGITVCLDTSGYGQPEYYVALLNAADHVLLDIKHTRDAAHRALTGKDLKGLRQFISALKGFQGTVTLRHVMVPGLTDQTEIMDELLDLIAPIQKIVDKIEILPYHKSGVEKYYQLNLAYALDDVPPMAPEAAERFERIVNEALHRRKAAGARLSA